MTESAELEKSQSSVPALVQTPALEIGAEDVALPRLYIGQYMSEQVQEDRVEPGSIFTALGKEDTEPNVLWTPGDDGGVVFHVLAMRKGKSISSEGELVRYAFDDPDAPADAWVTYNYVVCLPEVDQELPFKWLLTRTGKPAAQQINMVLRKGAAQGPAHTHAFEATTAPRENKKGKYFVPRVRPVEASQENVEVAATLTSLVANATSDITESTGDEPAI